MTDEPAQDRMDRQQRIERNERIVADMLTKEAMKEALKEWLDDQFTKFGYWSFYTILAAALAGAVYLIVATIVAKMPVIPPRM